MNGKAGYFSKTGHELHRHECGESSLPHSMFYPMYVISSHVIVKISRDKKAVCQQRLSHVGKPFLDDKTSALP
jgi:hypothetical protein